MLIEGKQIYLFPTTHKTELKKKKFSYHQSRNQINQFFCFFKEVCWEKKSGKGVENLWKTF